MWRCDLSAIRPVDLITVVYAWIVACCDNDSRCRLEIPYGKGEHRYRMKRIIKICPYSVCSEDKGCRVCEFIAVVPAVVGNDAGRTLNLLQIICKPLGDLADHECVDPVRPPSDDATHSRSAECQSRIEAVIEVVPVLSLQSLLDFRSESLGLLTSDIGLRLLKNVFLHFLTNVHLSSLLSQNTSISISSLHDITQTIISPVRL